MDGKRLRSSVVWLLAALVAAVVLAACGGPAAAPVPAAPENVTATPGPGYITVAWEHDGEHATGFRVLRSAGAASSMRAQQLSSIAEVGSGARTYVDTAPDIDGEYTYAVEAMGAGGASQPKGNVGGPVAIPGTCSDPGAEVYIADAALRVALRTTIGLESEAPITCGDLLSLTALVAPGMGIASLAGLQYATNLGFVDVSENSIQDVRPVARIPNLDGLNLDLNPVSGVTPLAQATNLTYLSLGNTGTTDISALVPLTSMQLLYLWENDVADISAVAGMTMLEVLYLSRNRVADLTPVQGLTNLRELHLAGEAQTYSDVTPLAGLVNLENLDLSYAGLDDTIWSSLDGLSNLRILNLSDNMLTTAAALSGMTQLEFLDIGGNQISDVDVVAGLANLTSLYVGSNPIADLSTVFGLTQLVHAGFSGLAITDVSSLQNFTALSFLDLAWNDIADIGPLVLNTGIGSGDRVVVSNNLLDLSDPGVLTDVQALIDRGVDLEYEPQK